MIGLWLIRSAAALAWWVDDPAEAEPVRAALVELWPGGPFVLRLGHHAGYGAWYADGTLHLVLPDGTREGPAGPDPGEQVVLARAWLRDLAPEHARPLRLAPAPWRTQAALLLGTGVGLEDAPAPIHAAVDVDASWRMLTLAGFVTVDLGAERAAESGDVVREQRGGLGAAAGVRVPLWGGELAVVAGPTLRVASLSAYAGSAWVPLAGVAERLHWWRAVAPGCDFGIGLSVAADGPGSSWTHPWTALGDDRYRRPEFSTAVEIGMAWAP
jgi:hypothetical protein